MRPAIIAYADGSPCPTLVLTADDLTGRHQGLSGELRRIRRWLSENDHADVLKIALIAPPQNASFDLDYRFVQCLPADDGAFELAGSCGHSILAAVLAAARMGLIKEDVPVRVRVRNNDDEVWCLPEQPGRYTVTFRQRRASALAELLLFGTPAIDIGGATVSGISFGNPYVFVRIADLGWHTPESLFSATTELFALLSTIRSTCEHRLGWRPGTFPKVAAVLPAGPGELAVRAISVPSWHPTLALTGVMCLTAAAAIPGTVAAALLSPASGPLWIRTPGSVASAQASTDGNRLTSVTTSGRTVRILEEVWLPVEVTHGSAV